ncbi:MAG: hypothetical protein LBP80_12440 [Treponema sp.]|jgi:hypothetical protein|nr:hypothetical protein [Treponema sp.]
MRKRYVVICVSFVLYVSCTTPGGVSAPKGKNSPPAETAGVLSENEAVFTVDNPTMFTVYFDGGQRVEKKSRGAVVRLAVEDAALTGGFDILYEIPLNETVHLFCRGDHKTIREKQTAFTVNEPAITENYGTYIKITNRVNNAVSFYTAGEANPCWEQTGDPVAGNNMARTSRREFSKDETPVFRIELNSRHDSYFIRDSRANIPLTLPPKLERNYMYSFEYSSHGAELVDARPLSRIGEPSWVTVIPGARGPMPLAAAGGRLFLFAPTDRGLVRCDFDSAGNGGTPAPNGSGFDITFAARSADGFFIAGYETDGRDYRPIARIQKEDGAPGPSLAPSARPDCRTAYFLTAAPQDGSAAWLLAGGGGDIAGHTAYIRLVHDEGGRLTALWELAGDDFDSSDPGVTCGPVKAAVYDSRRDRWLITGGNIEFDSLRRPVTGSYLAEISGGGTLRYIDASFKGMSFNRILVDAGGACYLAGEERQGNETLAALLKFDAGGGQVWRVSGPPPSHSYYQDAVLDGENSRIVLGGVMRAKTGGGGGGVPFVQAVDMADGTSLMLNPLSDPALGRAAVVTGICPAPDYGFALALSGIVNDSYAEPFVIARINSQGILFRQEN